MKKLFAFHGGDHKCGTTMLAQSVAELLAEADKEKNVLLVSLNGRQSVEYVKESTESIDKFKPQLDSGLSISKKLLTKSRYRDNLYIISGVENELEERYYMPENAQQLLTGLERDFDIIIADTGSELDNGLAIGGLMLADKRCIVLTQNESVIKRCEKNKSLYESLRISFDIYAVNKYVQEDPYQLSYIEKRLAVAKKSLIKIEMAGYGRQAEMDCKTLLEYREDRYMEDVLRLANLVGNYCGYNELKMQRKSKWRKSFTWTNT